ncbi:MAG: ABC transporter ATP-binding protein [Bacteroidales bacterium]|nr:ABC transporter ATP-binding protein [Bacteroidales bacterium]
MSNTIIKLEDISKQYRLGVVGTGTLSHDLNRWFAKIRRKEDPTLKIGASNVLDTVDGQYVWALKDINLDVGEGEVLGIIGKNGAGKSTLLKLLSRVTGPTTGTIKINGRIASLLEVGTGFHPELTGKENIYLNGAILGMTKKEISSKFDEIVDFSGVKKFVNTPVKRYSSGMYVRLAFAVAAHLEPETLIVDEVLAVGDAEFQKKAIGKMKSVSKSGRTVLFVSHNLTAVEQLCTRGVLMQNGTIIMDGKVHDITTAYKKMSVDENELKRSGARQIEFLDYNLTDENDKVTDEIYLGDSFIVNANIKANENIDNTDLSLDIRNDANEFISHVTNADDLFELKNINKGEKVSVSVKVKNLSLAPGTYYISLWLGNMYGTFDYIENCLRFSIRQGEKFILRPYPFDKRSKTVLQSKWNFR